jgi:hypothetical protein
MKKKLLLNYVYWPPVGHVLEAAKYAKGFYDANNNLEISVLLNKDSPNEMIKLCPWIKKTYSIDLSDSSKGLAKIPKKWDYVVIDKRARDFYSMSSELKGFHQDFFEKVNAKLWKGYTNFWKVGEKSPLKYIPNSKVALKQGPKPRDFMKKKLKSKKNICIMLGGSGGPGKYPSIESWIYILKELKENFPKYDLILTGVLKNNSGRTFTKSYGSKEIGKLKKEIPEIKDMYNIGLMNQVALVEACDLFISPHTGFGFIAPLVDTPWLAISGSNWPEYFLNDVSFYSAMDGLKHYPGYCFLNQPTKDQKERLRRYFGFDNETMKKRSKDILFGAKILLNEKISYEQSVKVHLKNLKKFKFKLSSFFFFDDAIKGKDFKKW